MRPLETAAKNIREYAAAAASARNMGRISRRPALRLDRAAARFDGRLHSRRPLSAAVHAADDRDSRAGGGRANHLRHLAASQRRDPGGGEVSRRRKRFPDRRRAGHRRAGLRHRNHSQSRSHRRSRQHLCRRRQESCWRAKSASILSPAPPRSSSSPTTPIPRYIAADMLAQAEHDVEASSILLTTSRTLAERVALEVARQLETLPTAPVACEVDPQQQRCDSVPVDGCGRRSIQSACAGASGDLRRQLCFRRSSTPAACSSVRAVPKPRAITPPVPITCCPPPARREFAAGFHRPIS